MTAVFSRGVLPVVAELTKQLREMFSAEHNPLGGPVTVIEHRPGSDIALDGLFTDGCAGLVWVNVIRLFHTRSFPAEDTSGWACRAPRAATIQIGAARCVATIDDQGYPPPADTTGHDALIGLDDADRLATAACRALKRLDATHLILASTTSPLEPIGPQGGALAWVMTITVQLP